MYLNVQKKLAELDDRLNAIERLLGVVGCTPVVIKSGQKFDSAQRDTNTQGASVDRSEILEALIRGADAASGRNTGVQVDDMLANSDSYDLDTVQKVQGSGEELELVRGERVTSNEEGPHI